MFCFRWTRKWPTVFLSQINKSSTSWAVCWAEMPLETQDTDVLSIPPAFSCCSLYQLLALDAMAQVGFGIDTQCVKDGDHSEFIKQARRIMGKFCQLSTSAKLLFILKGNAVVPHETNRKERRTTTLRNGQPQNSDQSVSQCRKDRSWSPSTTDWLWLLIWQWFSATQDQRDCTKKCQKFENLWRRWRRANPKAARFVSAVFPSLDESLSNHFMTVPQEPLQYFFSLARAVLRERQNDKSVGPNPFVAKNTRSTGTDRETKMLISIELTRASSDTSRGGSWPRGESPAKRESGWGVHGQTDRRTDCPENNSSVRLIWQHWRWRKQANKIQQIPCFRMSRMRFGTRRFGNAFPNSDEI